jgi:hypothetical protein
MDRATRKRMRQINRELTKINREFDARIKKSGKTADECSGEPWYADFMFQIIERDAEEKTLTSNSLELEARSLWLPIPPRDDDTRWERLPDTAQTRYLSPLGMTELRAAIRKERAEQRAVAEWWIKTLGATIGILTGLIGALIGLVSVLKR